MRRFLSCSRGATTIELGIFAMLAVLILGSGLSTVGEQIGGTFTKAGAAMASAPTPTPTIATTTTATSYSVQTEMVSAGADEEPKAEDTTWNFMEQHKE